MKPDRNDSSDEQAFARYRGRWIERALADRGLSDGAFRTLAGIAHHFLNRKERKMWAAQETIAVKLGISRRSVQEHLKELRERGLIRSQRQGRDKPNHYFPVVDDAQNSAYHDGDEAQIFAHQKSVMKRRSASDDAQNCVIKTREDLRTNTWKEPIEEPIEGGAGLQPAPASSSNVYSSDTISSDRSHDNRNAPSLAPEGASGASAAIMLHIYEEDDAGEIVERGEADAIIVAHGFARDDLDQYLTDNLRDEAIVDRLMNFHSHGKLTVGTVRECMAEQGRSRNAR